jgi:tetratricopeptide (TPR) repeat protein
MTRAVSLQSRVLAEGHPDRLAGLTRLAALYSDEGKYAEAAADFAKAVAIQVEVLGENHPDTLSSLQNLGRLQLWQRKYGEAEFTLRRALTAYEKVMPDSWERYNCQSLLGGSIEGRREYSLAEPLLLSGYQGMIQRTDAIPLEDRRILLQAGERIVLLYQHWGKPLKAEEWREKLENK